jgi:CRP-like cAMP-binding protein
MADTDTIRRSIQDRIRAARSEIARLEAAASALNGSSKRGTGRPPGTTASAPRASSASGRRRGRRRGSGARGAQAEKLVRENPGITISDLAKKMDIKPNYLYRVLPELRKDGKVRKRGKQWHPA